MTKKTVLIRAIPLTLIARLEAIQAAWLHDISFAGICREAMARGVEVLERLLEEPK